MRYKSASLYKKAVCSVVMFLMLLSQAVCVANAALVCTPDTSPTANLAGNLECVIANAVAALLEIGAVLALIAIIINGVKIATAGGDPKTIAMSRRSLTFAIIGALISVGGVFIVWFIGNLIGITDDFRIVNLSP